MSDTEFSLDNIDDFLENFFQKRPFKFESTKGFQMMSWSDINKLLEKDVLDYPRVRLANDSIPSVRGYKGFITYTLSVTGEQSPHINRYNLLKSLQSGSTLIIDRCQAYFEKVQAAIEYLNVHLRCRSSANLYCAWSSTPSFGAHFDNHDVIAIQIEGVKRWEIHDPTRSYPLLSDKSFDYEPPKGEPVMTHTLNPGQAIYLPAGYWHNVFTETEHSMHISFPVVRPRKIDIIKAVLEKLEGSSEMRAPVAYGNNNIENSNLYGVLISCLTEVNIDDWESAIIEDCINGRYVKFNLPQIRTRDE